MIIADALSWATKKLEKNSTTAALDSDVLLSFILKEPKEFLFIETETNLTPIQLKKFKSLISRRAKGEPVAYLTNQREFYGLNFYVDHRVLIPRPETELIIDEIKRFQVSGFRFQAIADVGTGSGAIIIALAKILPTIRHKPFAIRYYATDISKRALQVARKNAQAQKVKIKFFPGDLIMPLKNKKIDILVANLPYLDNNYQKFLDGYENIGLKFEPRLALKGGQFGIVGYQRLFNQINQLKTRPKFVFCEIGPTQTDRLVKIIKELLPQSQLEIKKDLAGLNRLLIIKL